MSKTKRTKRPRNRKEIPRRGMNDFFVCRDCAGRFRRVLLRMRAIDQARVCKRCHERETN